MNVCFVSGTEDESFTTESTLFLLSPTGSALLPCTLLPNRHYGALILPPKEINKGAALPFLLKLLCITCYLDVQVQNVYEDSKIFLGVSTMFCHLTTLSSVQPKNSLP